jgi:hypothetical protein
MSCTKRCTIYYKFSGSFTGNKAIIITYATVGLEFVRDIIYEYKVTKRTQRFEAKNPVPSDNF